MDLQTTRNLAANPRFFAATRIVRQAPSGVPSQAGQFAGQFLQVVGFSNRAPEVVLFRIQPEVASTQ